MPLMWCTLRQRFIYEIMQGLVVYYSTPIDLNLITNVINRTREYILYCMSTH